MLQSDQLEFILEAHNGLSAKIVEESGFKGLWGSGLSISAAMGVRDNNEASWTQVLEVLEFINGVNKFIITFYHAIILLCRGINDRVELVLKTDICTVRWWLPRSLQNWETCTADS